MGRRGAAESVVKALGLLLERPRWRQAELARELELSTPAARKLLHEMSASMDLTSERDGAHVYWTLSDAWLSDGLRVARADLPVFFTVALAGRRGPRGDAFVRKCLVACGWGEAAADAVSVDAVDESAERHRRLLVDAQRLRRAVRIHYHAQNTGDLEWKVVSPQQIDERGTPTLVAWSHERDALRTFRLDRIIAAALHPTTPFHAVSSSELDEFARGAVDGFRSDARTPFWFTVRTEARWVRDNLPRLDTVRVTTVDDALRVEGEVASVAVLARFVVGIGPHVVAMDPALATAVRDIALAAAHAAKGSLNGGSVESISTTSKRQIGAGDGVHAPDTKRRRR